MKSPESTPIPEPEENKEAQRPLMDKDIEGEGFVLRSVPQSFGHHDSQLARLEFRPGETTGKAHIKENIRSVKAEKEWIKKHLKPGDLVQWDEYQFEEPRAVIKISEDREFVFVEGSEVGIPIDQISRE